MSDLQPPDLERCQAEKPNPDYSPMSLGGDMSRRVRCEEEPDVVAVEIEPGPDGDRGAMSLCGECQDVLEEQHPGKTAYRPIEEVEL